jgi:hypothetical protein
MDTARAALLWQVLAGTEWVERTRVLGRTLRRSTERPGGLLLVGTPTEDPWHLAAHLDDEARFSGIAELSPTLVRWSPPPGAPPHLSVGLDRLEGAGRGETLFVVSPDEEAPAPLLERVADARSHGATILSIGAATTDLAELSHESLCVPYAPAVAQAAASRTLVDERLITVDSLQHLVSLAAGEAASVAGIAGGRRGLRDRLARFLDTMSGPVP